jgi:uncharacterized protein
MLTAIAAKEKLFFFSFADEGRHNRRVTIAIGATLNAAGILLGAIIGLARRRSISPGAQVFFRNVLGAAALFFGFRLVWLNLDGTFVAGMEQMFIALVAVVLGNLMGRVLGLQKISNHLGRHAADLIAIARNGQNPGAGFNACAILYCVAPLGILGAIADGLTGYFWLLAVKAVMDGLAMAGFVKMFRWPAALSAMPVFLFFSLVSLTCRSYAAPSLTAAGLADSIGVASGFVACAVALVIFEVRKVALANYLPALVVAPLLTWLVRTI